MQRSLQIFLLAVSLAALCFADSDRPSPFGPKPNGRGYEKSHQRAAATSVKGERAVVPEQQRARSGADTPSASSFTASGDSETGSASYSGSELDGRPTASGEIFDSSALTAAHPSLPIGSYVRVTNLSTNRFVIVRINDRCRANSNRVIQVTKSAAQELGLIGGSSNVTVKVEPVTPEDRASR